MSAYFQFITQGKHIYCQVPNLITWVMVKCVKMPLQIWPEKVRPTANHNLRIHHLHHISSLSKYSNKNKTRDLQVY